MKKRILSLLMVGILLASVAVGCTEKPATTGTSTDPSTASSSTGSTSAVEPTGDKIELLFWDFHDNQEGDFFQSLADNFTAEQEKYSVRREMVPGDDYRGPKMATAFASGTGPDILEVFPGSLIKYANSGVLQPLNDYITPEVLADFYETSMDAVTVNGDIVAIPFEIELLAVYYNAEAFKDAGVEPPKTWTELAEVSAKLTNDTQYGYTMDVVKGEHQLFEWYPWLWQTGGNVFSDDGKSANFNNPGVIENLKIKRQMFEDGTANIKPTRTDAGLLGDRESAMHQNGSWGLSNLERDYPDTEFGLMPIPVMEGGTPASVAGGWKMCANKLSPNVEGAVEFVIWSFGSDDTSRMAEWCTSTKFAYPTRQSVLDANMDTYTNGAIRTTFTEQVLGTEKIELRLPPEVSAILQDMLQTCYFDNSVEVETAVTQAEEKVNEFLATYEGSL